MLKLAKYYDVLPWLDAPRQRYVDLIATDRCPHALLIHGAHGSGRRQLALWLAEAKLGEQPGRPAGTDGEEEAGHPDYIELVPETDAKTGKERRTVSVDQVRALIEFLSLTSHGPRGRVAVVYPAESMTVQAANSLLKTLEEPPDNTLIILITESLSRLPATVISRCQRLRIPPPETEAAVAWLRQHVDDEAVPALLDFAGGAPLAALELLRDDFAATAAQYAADVTELERRLTSPVAVAQRWKSDPDQALQWLHWRLSARVRKAMEVLARGELDDERQVDRAQKAIQASFRQMSQIRELRRLINGGINAELNLAGLLTDWYGGLGMN